MAGFIELSASRYEACFSPDKYCSCRIFCFLNHLTCVPVQLMLQSGFVYFLTYWFDYYIIKIHKVNVKPGFL